MCGRAVPPYNSTMTTTTASLARADALLTALAAHDFDGIADAFEPDAKLSALLPRGYDEWHDTAGVRAAFERWFGDVEELEVADASVGRIGDLLQLRWRVRVQGGRFGARAMVVEQYASAHLGPSGRIARLSLLCTGFWPQPHITDHKEQDS
jgi:hypothetical protein